ncbi:hypothetical protein [Paenibacillus medicaginis]|uniref:Uncharacterized protein n=1 Tax=Paenibacillus medicaginis TaxID=1470560 RepID=A0ABV5C290_9BACL
MVRSWSASDQEKGERRINGSVGYFGHFLSKTLVALEQASSGSAAAA